MFVILEMPIERKHSEKRVSGFAHLHALFEHTRTRRPCTDDFNQCAINRACTRHTYAHTTTHTWYEATRRDADQPTIIASLFVSARLLINAHRMSESDSHTHKHVRMSVVLACVCVSCVCAMDLITSRRRRCRSTHGRAHKTNHARWFSMCARARSHTNQLLGASAGTSSASSVQAAHRSKVYRCT